MDLEKSTLGLLITSIGKNSSTYVLELKSSAFSGQQLSTVQENIIAQFPNTTNTGFPTGCVTFFPDQHIIVGSPVEKPTLLMMDLQEKKQLFVCNQLDRMTCLSTSKDSIYCFGGSKNGCVYIWKTATGELMKVFEAHSSGSITSLEVTPDNSFLITGGKDSNIFVWNMTDILDFDNLNNKSAEPILSLQGHSLEITSLHCTKGSNKKIFSSSIDGTVIVWDLSTGTELCKITLYSPILNIAVSPLENMIYCGTLTGKIYEINLFPSNSGSNSNMESQSDKENELGEVSILVTESTQGSSKKISIEQIDEQQIKVEAASNSKLNTNNKNLKCSIFQGHSNKITDLAITKDGTILISSSLDGCVHIWNIQSKQILHTFKRRTAATFEEFTNCKIINFSKRQIETVSIQPINSQTGTEKMKELTKAKNVLVLPVRPLMKFISGASGGASGNNGNISNNPVNVNSMAYDLNDDESLFDEMSRQIPVRSSGMN